MRCTIVMQFLSLQSSPQEFCLEPLLLAVAVCSLLPVLPQNVQVLMPLSVVCSRAW